ncbi:MAG: RHS repeat-associated core domain-containing protein, partial [Chthoniobacterales bacterium]
MALLTEQKKILQPVNKAISAYSVRFVQRYQKKFYSTFEQALLSLLALISFLNQSITLPCLLTSVTQSYGDSSTGPESKVTREYNACGQLVNETTSLNGTNIASWQQEWDGAGRRVGLNWKLEKQGPEYQFAYNAAGLMTSSGNESGTCSYGYADNGLLTSRETPFGTTRITRDARGNIRGQTLPNGAQESLIRRRDGRISSYSIVDDTEALISETRNYQYDSAGRVIEEPFTLRNSLNPNALNNGTHEVKYTFDELNIRTSSCISPTGTSLGGSTGDAVREKNGFGQVTLDIIYSSDWYYYPWNYTYDNLGAVASRGIDGNRTETNSWDSFGRLVKVIGNSDEGSYTWRAIYDGLGRRIQTTIEGATRGTTTYYYDPEVEFLELGHDNNGRTWNLYGPDRSGTYGGAQGIGGLEATYTLVSGTSAGVVNNYFGDALGTITGGHFTAYDSLLGSYGAMPGSSINQNLTPQWRDHYLDPTGFYYMGARYYEPNSGRFLSPDPLGHDASLSLYDYCNGDP